MARPLRIHVPGMLYHVMCRGNAKQPIFADDSDYQRYLDVLEEGLTRFRVDCLAYCALFNHVHLLLKPADIAISRVMQQVNSHYCQSFNRRHQRVGHVLQGRFKTSLIDSDRYFLAVLRYIALNPVEAQCATHPSGWRWSSYRATAGLDRCPRFLQLQDVWRAFGSVPRAAQRRFGEFVAATADRYDPHAHLLVGSDAFVERFQPLLRPHRQVEDFTYAERYAARPPLVALLPPGIEGPALARAIRVAFQQHAYTLREIGVHLGRPRTTVWHWIHRGGRPMRNAAPPTPVAKPATHALQ